VALAQNGGTRASSATPKKIQTAHTGEKAEKTTTSSDKNLDEVPGNRSDCEVQKYGELYKGEPLRTSYFIKSIDGTDVIVILKDVTGCLVSRGITESHLRLVLDGQELPDVNPVQGPESYVKFTLVIDPYNTNDRKLWAKIIRDMRASASGITISVEDNETGQVFPSEQLLIINLYPSYSGYVVMGLAVLLLGLVTLGFKSNILRDNPGSEKSSNASYPFSLGRIQMVFWFYLVVAGYVYIWLLTGKSYTPAGSVIALLGISSATGLAAAIVDRSKNSDSANKILELKIQQAALETRISELEKASPSDGSELGKLLADKKDQLATITQQLVHSPLPATSRSANIFKDLVCDGDGVSFHRFQIVVWTLVLGMVFIRAVQQDLAMPDFDATLLGLMGLSSGTYIGFKFPEKAK
jgi:hypothetical protein